MTLKKIDDSKVELKNNISWDVWKDYLKEATKEASKDLKVEGFRPGKAPQEVVEKNVGKEVLLNSAAEKAIQKDYPELLKKEEVNAIGSPQIEI